MKVEVSSRLLVNRCLSRGKGISPSNDGSKMIVDLEVVRASSSFLESLSNYVFLWGDPLISILVDQTSSLNLKQQDIAELSRSIKVLKLRYKSIN